jgi:DNA-binding XRE family transcriptional regulator
MHAPELRRTQNVTTTAGEIAWTKLGNKVVGHIARKLFEQSVGADRRQGCSHARTLPETPAQATPPVLAQPTSSQLVTKIFGTPSYSSKPGFLLWFSPVPLPKHRRLLGEAVRLRRKRAKLSQEKLAEKASLSTVFISHVERGVENISLDAVVRIAKALGVRVRNLVRDF